MIEFTISRVMLCVCGMVLIASVTGALNGIHDVNREASDGDLADRFAYMLDVFQSSGNDTLVLDGARLLPEGYSVSVHDGFVELFGGGDRQMAMTRYAGEFEMDWEDTLTVTRRRSRRSS